ncbi:hypothetical protein ABZZ74_49025 [Streptomyces sp. NPDC006476]|uniref:hypothetical protein n=1 Tax=Streptomyces sp. NPDC006476 TaxID=3157175 RepID=UPI0033B9634F
MPAPHDIAAEAELGALDTVVCDMGGVIIRFDTGVAQQIEDRHGLDTGSLPDAALKSPSGRQAMASEMTHNTGSRP